MKSSKSIEKSVIDGLKIELWVRIFQNKFMIFIFLFFIFYFLLLVLFLY